MNYNLNPLPNFITIDGNAGNFRHFRLLFQIIDFRGQSAKNFSQMTEISDFCCYFHHTPSSTYYTCCLFDVSQQNDEINSLLSLYTHFIRLLILH